MKQTKTKQKNNKRLLSERLSSYFCPLLLGAAICYAIMYVLYEPVALTYTLIFLAEELLLFIFFDKLKTYTVACGFVYTLILFILTAASVRLVFRGIFSGYGNPIDWFYGEEGVDGNKPYFLYALAIGGGYFLSSILYYFTQIRYRSLGMMLCTLFPFVLYAKRGDEMPEILITLIITMFLAVMVHNRRIDPARDKAKLGRLKTDRAYMISFALFISVTGALAMTIKKPTYRSQLEKNADFFDTLLWNGAGASGYENMSRSSGTRRGGFSYNNTPLFYLETDRAQGEYYLRRQVFEKFNGSLWEGGGVNFWREAPYSMAVPEYSTDDILNDITAVSGNMDIAAPDTEQVYKIKSARVYDTDFSPTFLPAPYGTITDDLPLSAIKYSKYPPSASVMRIRNWAEHAEPLNDSFQYIEPQTALKKYAEEVGMTGEEYLDKLAESLIPGGYSGDLEQYIAEHEDEIFMSPEYRLAADYITAENTYSDKNGISDRLAALAHEITADCKSDIEKAEALEKYFEKSGFQYSTEYVPRDNSIDYFVFESQIGYCAAYATAMTLMARAADLPARYVEGFAAFERTDDGSIIIREGHAHAFVEVYIPAVGWMTFDPTVSDYLDMTSGTGNFNADFLFYFLFLLSRFFIVLIVGFLVIFVLLFDRIKEVLFRIALVFMPVKKRIPLLYKNLIGLVNFSTKDDYSAYTVKMLRSYLNESRGTAPELLLDLFEKTVFGGYSPTKEEYTQAYKQYKACYKYMRKIPKNKDIKKQAEPKHA